MRSRAGPGAEGADAFGKVCDACAAIWQRFEAKRLAESFLSVFIGIHGGIFKWTPVYGDFGADRFAVCTVVARPASRATLGPVSAVPVHMTTTPDVALVRVLEPLPG